ncbi:MAG: sensor histidine kinase [Chloroflexi bacterium]|nr:sensor histidine kinase [Chloroflexota bacterium]
MTIAARAFRAAPLAGWWAWPRPLIGHRWSLAQQYLVASLIVVLAGVLITGAWIGHQIETSVVERTGGITALYVDSVIGPHLQALALDDRWLTPDDAAALNGLVADTGLGEGVVQFKIWSRDGRILYSTDPALVGQQFPVDDFLQQAINGQVSADISNLDAPENRDERQHFSRLVEVYAPVRQNSDGRVIAINEFYLLPDALDQEIRDAQLSSWAVVAGIGLVTYLLLAGIVKRGSDTIRHQQRELERRLEQNTRLHERVRQAAGRTTALNEQALRRVSADLHDGPGQALALALLRLDALQAPCADNVESCRRTHADFETVHSAVRDALSDLRAISAGLRLQELERLTVVEVASRAIDDHQRRSRVTVQRQLESLPEQAPLAIKIALVRTLQEALSNATRHGRGADVRVELDGAGDRLRLKVSDRGPGFDTQLAERSGGLGLAGMRERAELLGGRFAVESSVGAGTTVQAWWPLSVPVGA